MNLIKDSSANGNYSRPRHGTAAGIINHRPYHANNMQGGYPMSHLANAGFKYPPNCYPDVGASSLRIPNHVQGPPGLDPTTKDLHIATKGLHIANKGILIKVEQAAFIYY
ncbi:hypothetical protein J6590_037118 [Homalodisca vitripennis]|nr:hypothetical protein J6590_037118 [Homalodisca vitripennis]